MKSSNEHVAIRMFGMFDILYNGESVLQQKKISARNIELLKFLLINTDKLVTARNILESLWSEENFADEKACVKTYVYRLRSFLSGKNALGVDISKHLNLVSKNDGYCMEIAKDVKSDLREFDELCAAIAADKNADSLKKNFLKLAGLCEGAFMGQSDISDEPWLLQQKKYNNNTFCAMADHTLKHLKEAERHEDMVEVCNAALAEYPSDEMINIHLIEALSALGRFDDARRCYQHMIQEQDGLAVSNSLAMNNLRRHMHALQYEDIVGKENYREITKTVYRLAEDFLKANSNRFSICYIQIKYGRYSNRAVDVLVIRGILDRVLRQALRKQDMYTVIDKDHAIALLHEADRHFYEIIIQRIGNLFSKETTKEQCQLDISILKTKMIV